MPVLKNNVVEVLPNTFWMMLLSTVRYAMGRRTYAVSEAVDLVLKSQKALNGSQIDQIIKEVKEELARSERMGKFLGDKFDHEDWQNLVRELEKTLASSR